MNQSFFDDLVERSEAQHQQWLAGAAIRQTVPANEWHDFAVATIYAGGSLAAGFIATDADTLANAKRIYDAIIAAAEQGGFTDTDVLGVYFRRQTWTPTAAEIADDMISCIGGVEAFIDLFDLSARPLESMGSAQ